MSIDIFVFDREAGPAERQETDQAIQDDTPHVNGEERARG
jgi:hypothetical protein